MIEEWNLLRTSSRIFIETVSGQNRLMEHSSETPKMQMNDVIEC